MGMLDAEHWDTEAEATANLTRSRNVQEQAHAIVCADLVWQSGRIEPIRLPKLGTKNEVAEYMRNEAEKRNLTAETDAVVAISYKYKVARATIGLECPFTIEKATEYVDYSDLVERIQNEYLPACEKSLEKAQKYLENAISKDREDLISSWSWEIELITARIEKMRSVVDSWNIADDIQELAEEDRRYNAKEREGLSSMRERINKVCKL